MNLEEFEFQARNEIETTLNQLQTIMLLVAELDAQFTGVQMQTAHLRSQVSAAGDLVQKLSQLIEDYLLEQKQ